MKASDEEEELSRSARVERVPHDEFEELSPSVTGRSTNLSSKIVMTCVINQPNYIPWRGYFHQIRKADVFVFYDDVQYDKHGWRNRNRIKTANGPIWLTIPVIKKGAVKNHTPIDEIFIDWTRNWSNKHWKTIEQAYGKAPFFEIYASTLKEIYEQRYDKLADLTIQVTILIAGVLGISGTKFVRSSSLNAVGTKTNRLLEILGRLGATH